MPASLQILLPDRLDRDFRRWAKRTPGSSWPAWGGHVTLLPRVVITHLDAATLRQRIEAVCARYEPFVVCMDEILHDADYTRPGYRGVFLRMRSSNSGAVAKVTARSVAERSVAERAALPSRSNPEDETLEMDSVALEATNSETVNFPLALVEPTEADPAEILILDLSASDLNEIGSVAVYDVTAASNERGLANGPVGAESSEIDLYSTEVDLPASGYYQLRRLRNELLDALAEGAAEGSETAEALRTARQRDFRPHLTLALSLGEQEAQQIVEAARAAELEAQFTVRRVWLLIFDRDAAAAENTQRIEFSLGKERTLSIRNLSRAVDLRRDKSPAAPTAPSQWSTAEGTAGGNSP